jgi:uncharacterized protein
MNFLDIIKKLVSDLGFKKNQIEVVLQLLEDGNTIPFIARYRKEMTGGLDEVEILSIQEKYEYESKLEERKLVVIEKIKSKDKLTKELEVKILRCTKLKEVEDLYRPYIEKKNSKADDARKKGLETIAEKVIIFDINFDLEKTIKDEIKRNKKVKTREEVVDGIKEIVKEKIIENVEIREDVRKEYSEKSFIVSKVKDELKDINGTYNIYYDYKEEVKKVPSHRLLAMKRGESEGILKLSYDVEKETILKKIKERFVGGNKTSVEEFIEDVVKESYSKSLKGSIEREITSELKENSDLKAIDVFKKNLEDLLLTSPIKGRVILGLDPAFRTGCKLSVIDKNGTFLEKGLIYPHAPVNKVSESKDKLKAMLKKHNVTLVAIGNGTASRESEQFVVEVFKEMKEESSNIQYVIVNEAGASVYSASEVAREEFPHFSVEERSAVSIARRVLDPLAELVKIDPKSIGIGQYQHDVDKRELDKALNFTIEKVVNRVGINVNTASIELLSHVAGLNKKIASNIVDYRNKNGSFNSRIELKKVKGLGPKAYEQSVGFLRIYDGSNKLDETGIHPESYAVATHLVTDMDYKLSDIGTDNLSDLSPTIRYFNESSESSIRTKTGVGKSTVIDILHELQKPRRDIREETGEILLRSDILKIDDLHVGLELKGTVRNVVDFGAFVDIGLKGDGLVHISKMVNRFIKHPSEVVSVGDIVTVWVESVDLERGKVSLRMV